MAAMTPPCTPASPPGWAPNGFPCCATGSTIFAISGRMTSGSWSSSNRRRFLKPGAVRWSPGIVEPESEVAMKIVLSWLRDYIDIKLPLEEIARLMTMAGLEVGEVQVIGLPVPPADGKQEFKFTGLAWDPEKIVVAQVDEVMPHPNADRLVLCRLNDGQNEYIVLTGAPNLYPYKGKGSLEKPIKVAYAKEGSVLYDGHQPGQVLTTLKRAKIRGVDSFSMVCSEKELGISEEHEGVIFLDDDAPTGMALADYIGDAVFEIDILPNMIRDACVIGVARELSAVTGLPLRMPVCRQPANGPSIEGQVKIEIRKPELNPRFV